MKRHLLTLVGLLLAMLVQAQDVRLDYCRNTIAGNGEGAVFSKTGSKKNMNCAIYLPAERLKSYVGCQLSAVMGGLPDVDDANMPQALTGWIRVDSLGGEPVAVTESSAAVRGWNTLRLTTPYTITGEEQGIYVGFFFYQEKALKCISLAGPKDVNGCFIGTDGKIKYNGATLDGSVAVRAVLEGGVPTRDMALSAVERGSRAYRLGEEIVVTGNVENHAATAATNPVIKATVNGVPACTYTVETTVRQDDAIPFKLNVPTSMLTEECLAEVTLSLEWADGQTDEIAADNKASVTVDVLQDVAHRKMIVEEGTGTWCGWCVRGYVGLKYMKLNHSDRYIGIGVHNGDEFVYEPYDAWIKQFLNGYPGSRINRLYGSDPNYNALEQALLAMDDVGEVNVDVQAKLDGDLLYMQADVRKTLTTDSKYRIAFVVLEDSVLTNQKNYYEGGGSGAMDGFENLSSPCQIYMNDIARYISNPEGDVMPAELAKGETGRMMRSVDLTTIGKNKVTRYEMMSVVALVIDDTTGEILNGQVTEDLNADLDVTAIRGVDAGAPARSGYYDLQGRRLTQAPAHGIFISNGKIIMK